MRFYLDQDVDVCVGARLSALGHDALTTRDAGNLRKSNGEQLLFATAENRVLLTHNRRHFRRLHRQWQAGGREHPGIILSKHLRRDELVRRLAALWGSVSTQGIRSQLLSLSDFR